MRHHAEPSVILPLAVRLLPLAVQVKVIVHCPSYPIHDSIVIENELVLVLLAETLTSL